MSAERSRYLAAYARLREREGRGSGGEAELLALPYVTTGPLASQWEVRARTYDRFVGSVLAPCARAVAPRPLRVLDLGAGNGWLCYRLSLLGHRPVALDLRMDAVDGLGAAAPYARHLPRVFERVAGSFEDLPFRSRLFDVALFNASLHYAERLSGALVEAARVVASGGRLAILDSPFYGRPETGEAMVQERRRNTRRDLGDLAEDLLAVSSIEFLTRERLKEVGATLGLRFRRRRVFYPLWYEWRKAAALLGRKRAPSRFDLWESRVP